MKATNPEVIALKFVEYINNQDIDGLVSLMTEGFTMIAHEGEPEVGRELMKEGFQDCEAHCIPELMRELGCEDGE